MSVVSNSSPLIALARIQRLDLVPVILQSALIPPAVAREISPSIPVLPRWLEVRAPTRPASVLTPRGRLVMASGRRSLLLSNLAQTRLSSTIVLQDDWPRRQGSMSLALSASYWRPSGRAALEPFVPNSTSCSKRRSSLASSSTIRCCASPVNTGPDESAATGVGFEDPSGASAHRASGHGLIATRLPWRRQKT